MTWQHSMVVALMLPLTIAATPAAALNITVTLNSNNTTQFQMTTGANESVPYLHSNNRGEVVVHSQDQD